MRRMSRVLGYYGQFVAEIVETKATGFTAVIALTRRNVELAPRAGRF